MVSVRTLLDAHEASVIERIAVLRAELIPLERELLEVRLAKAALKKEPEVPEQKNLVFFKTEDQAASASHIDAWRQRLVSAAHDIPKSPYSRMTIKELVKKALVEHFPEGATANDLLDVFANAWGRTEIERTSLSPQLSRLRRDNILFRQGHIWRLTAASGLLPPNTKTAADQ